MNILENVSYSTFIREIAKDFKLTVEQEYILKLPSDNIKSFTQSVAKDVRIFDGENEYPYMLSNNIRNNEQMKNAIELRRLGTKSLEQIIKEANISLITEKCKICEGGGWYSSGIKYIYKNIYCKL